MYKLEPKIKFYELTNLGIIKITYINILYIKDSKLTIWSQGSNRLNTKRKVVSGVYTENNHSN